MDEHQSVSASSSPSAIGGSSGASGGSGGFSMPSSLTKSSPKRRAKLQRSERLCSDSHTPYSSWETLVRDSFGQVAWPIKITSWELVENVSDVVPTR